MGTEQMADHSYKLTFSAHIEHIDTGETETDAKLLKQLDGVEEMTDLASNVVGDELSGIELRRARPVLHFDPRKRELYMEIEFVTARAVTDRDRELLARFIARQMHRGWGTNYEFELPASLADYVVHFETEPRETVPRAAATAVAPLIARYQRVRIDDLDGKSDEELAAICADLGPHVRELQIAGVDDASAHAVASLHTVAKTRLQHRAAERAGVPKVAMDNLDAIDDLPDDVF
jgi:hypothetical protein